MTNPCKADLAIKVEGNTHDGPGRPVAVMVLAGRTILAEVSIAKVRMIIKQIDAMPFQEEGPNERVTTDDD